MKTDPIPETQKHPPMPTTDELALAIARADRRVDQLEEPLSRHAVALESHRKATHDRLLAVEQSRHAAAKLDLAAANRINELVAAVTAVNFHLDALDSRVEALDDIVAERFTALISRVDKLNLQLQDRVHQVDLARTERSLTNLDARHDALLENTAQLESRLDNLTICLARLVHALGRGVMPADAPFAEALERIERSAPE
jgi:DNA repair exonuclease SbcCD ATPase subunit